MFSGDEVFAGVGIFVRVGSSWKAQIERGTSWLRQKGVKSLNELGVDIVVTVDEGDEVASCEVETGVASAGETAVFGE